MTHNIVVEVRGRKGDVLATAKCSYGQYASRRSIRAANRWAGLHRGDELVIR